MITFRITQTIENRRLILRHLYRTKSVSNWSSNNNKRRIVETNKMITIFSNLSCIDKLFTYALVVAGTSPTQKGIETTSVLGTLSFLVFMHFAHFFPVTPMKKFFFSFVYVCLHRSIY